MRRPLAAPMLPNTGPILFHRPVWHPLLLEKTASTGSPFQVPVIVAVCGPPTIIGHITPRGTGAKGSCTRPSAAHAAAASGCVPRGGSQMSVQRTGAAPALALTVITSEAFGPVAAGLAGLVGLAAPPAEPEPEPATFAAWMLPQPARAAASAAATAATDAPRVTLLMHRWTRPPRTGFPLRLG
jgi:hypothetical protein